jgi:hypothetical protein
MAPEIENFEEVKLKGEAFYKTIEPTYCPYLQQKVHFNAEGLEHLKFKRRRMARPRQDQYMRFKLLRLAPEVLTNSKTVQGIWETKEFITVRTHSRNEQVLKPVTYYEFIAVIKQVRIKIIIRKIHEATPMFWSIIPFWGVNPLSKMKKLHSGNVLED